MPDKAPVCPWCGSKMKPDRTFMSMLPVGCRPTFWWLCGHCGARSPVCDSGDKAYAAAVKRVEPMQKPLTLDELRQMGGEPVYIVEHPDWGHWELSEDAEDYLDREKAFYDMRCTFRKMCSSTICKTPFDLHCMGWLAFRRKPTDEERKAAGWDDESAVSY